jgi:prephenate dehydrogenase
MRKLGTVAVIGVGLVGGSLAMALRRAAAAASLVGYDRDGEALERAAALGVIDRAADSVSEATKGADLVVVAVPVRAIGTVLHDVSLALDPAAVVTDVGSTKGEVVRIAAQELRERAARFVPGHPIAGRETSGVESAPRAWCLLPPRPPTRMRSSSSRAAGRPPARASPPWTPSATTASSPP